MYSCLHMKFLIVLVAVFALVYCDTKCTSSTTPSLEDEINDITKLIPLSKVKAIAVKYIANDAQVQEVISYMKGDEFAAIVKLVNCEKLVIDLYSYLCANGVPIYNDIKTVNDLLGLPEVQPQYKRISPSDRTFHSILDEVEAVLPLDDMKKEFQDKVKTCTVFKAFYDKISGSEFKAMVDQIWALSSVQDAKTKLAAKGADVKKLVSIAQELLGWVPQ